MKPMLELGNLAICLTTYYHTTYLCKYSQNQVFLIYLVLNLGLTLSKVESKGHRFHHHPNLHKKRPHRLWVRLTILCPNVVIFFVSLIIRYIMSQPKQYLFIIIHKQEISTSLLMGSF